MISFQVRGDHHLERQRHLDLVRCSRPQPEHSAASDAHGRDGLVRHTGTLEIELFYSFVGYGGRLGHFTLPRGSNCVQTWSNRVKTSRKRSLRQRLSK